MKTLIALGIVVGIVAGGIIGIVATTSDPAQAGQEGLPSGVSYFTDRGHDCYIYRGYKQGGITCVNPVEGANEL